VGVIFGTRVITPGHNIPASITPLLAIGFVR
jgi:hypothetical protein